VSYKIVPDTHHGEDVQRLKWVEPSRWQRDEANKHKAALLLEKLRYKYDVKHGVVARWAPALPFFRRLAPYLPYLVIAYLLWWFI
jgi:hypothetical protein